MKRIHLFLLAAILFCGSLQIQAQNEGVTLYFSAEEMPDLIKCLPPPPDTIGTDFANDIMRYMWGKQQRNDAERAALVFQDAVWNYDSIFHVFSVPFGLEITKDGTPEIYKLLMRLPDCPEYNKILCSLGEDHLFLAIAQGDNLMLANSFPVQDFTTAEYYIFLALKSLQLNPEISTICWRTPLDAEDEMSLYRYFKAVINL